MWARDPRCHYDAATHTWFATILAINKEETESFIDVAVNTSGDPRKAWTTYKINATDPTEISNRLGNRARAAALPIGRVRTVAVMERFLARVVAVFPATDNHDRYYGGHRPW